MLLPALAGCPPPAQVADDPRLAGTAAIVVTNQTTWPVSVEAEPVGDPAGTLVLGDVPAGETVTFRNVPAARQFRLRAVRVGGTETLIGPTRSPAAEERWEWIVLPGNDWTVP